MSNATATLDRFATDTLGSVVEVTILVSGGASHNERRDAALDALEAFTERTDRPVPLSSYEVRAKGQKNVEFRFFAD